MFGLSLSQVVTFVLGVCLGLYLGNKDIRLKVNNMIDGLLKKKVAKPDATNIHQTSTDTKKGERDD